MNDIGHQELDFRTLRLGPGSNYREGKPVGRIIEEPGFLSHPETTAYPVDRYELAGIVIGFIGLSVMLGVLVTCLRSNRRH